MRLTNFVNSGVSIQIRYLVPILGHIFFFHLYVTQFLPMYNGNYKGTYLIRRHIEGAQLMLAMIFILKKT